MNMNNARARSLAAAMTVAAVSCAVAIAQLDPKIDRLVSVRLNPGISIETFNARYGSTTERAIASRAIYLVRISDPNETEEEFSNRVSGDTVWAEPTYFGDGPEGSGRNFYCTILPSNAQYLSQGAWTQINLGTAHMVSTGDGINIAIVDTGLDVDHVVMAGRVLSGGWNYAAPNGGNADISDVGDGIDNDLDGDIDELVGHGTHMAGIVAHIAPDAMILPIKVLDSEGNTDTFTLAQGIFHAIDRGGIDVINLSIGSTYDAKPIEDALAEARAAGIVVAGAAGNVDVEDPSWEFPALRDEVIGVVGVDGDDIKAEFTNVNTAFDISAPALHVWSTIPDNLYADLDGTSPATAMISGAAALLLAANPDWTRNATRVGQVESYLGYSAADIGPLNLPEYAGKMGGGRLDAGAALNISIVFDQPKPYPTGAFPTAVAAVDLDGDYVADLAVANNAGNTVTVLRNLGDGSFIPVADYPVGLSPEDIVAATLDADHHPDLAIPNAASNSVSVLINNGGGTFGAAASYAVGLGPNAIAAGDLDGDGDVDLAVANEDSDSVTVLINNGSGAFSAAGLLAVGDRPRDIVAAHLNLDNNLDLATVNRRTNDVSVLFNLGGGTFAPAVSLSVGDDPRYLVAADFDTDDDLDIVTSNNGTDNMTLLPNNGDGTFAPGIPIDIFGANGPGPMTIGDFDCDDDLDIATITGDGGAAAVTIVLNDDLGALTGRLDFAAGDSPQGLAAADLDDDADLDLAVSDGSANAVGILFSQSCPSRGRGDLNCDGHINAFDIEDFILALVDPAGYSTANPTCDIGTGDINRDGAVDAFDIEPFIDLLLGG
jgi:hypothetical protein